MKDSIAVKTYEGLIVADEQAETLEKLRQRKPEKIIETAVRGMLPKGSLGRRIFTNLLSRDQK